MLPATFLGLIGLHFDLNRNPSRTFTRPGIIRSFSPSHSLLRIYRSTAGVQQAMFVITSGLLTSVGYHRQRYLGWHLR